MTREIFLVDIQTFYASVEKADHPEFKDKPLIVAGDPKQRSGIVLAADPVAKSYGIKTAESVGQALLKCPQAVLVRPRMQHYLDISLLITQILKSFTDLVEPYSVDEQFLDITGSRHLFGTSDEIARTIQKKIMKDTGVRARIGIGTNKVLAKMACDNFAKKNTAGIFRLDQNNIEKCLWPLPIRAMFSVGSHMEKHLIGMGIRTVGMLASTPVELLRKRWGINGVLLWQTANGIDSSPVTVHTYDRPKAIGHNITLPYDYVYEKDIKTIILELAEEVARGARAKHCRGNIVSIGVRGANFDHPTGFYRQITIFHTTSFGMDIYHAASILFDRFWDRQPIRSIAVTLSGLHSDKEYQLSLFDQSEKKEKLNAAIDAIHQKYGRTALFRGPSLRPSSQLRIRSKKIGGHWK
ncbi:DNA polymerase IV [Sporolactobacillus sp. CPB3-1]|uniref:DNA polymerase IV n=1 Tax=Sporolactobacillus mangiferae TaxID=2940498 RepID=A0ABT0M6R2_9BACL|nr:DNA polymerase IV [Sporolactobacillus mangiferae]MCL1630543.1 DNA polymerase IV [Sporolactobacillus mangiferae]